MRIRRRTICLISLLLIFVYICPFAYASDPQAEESAVVTNSSPTERIDGTLQSFDVSPNGDILLFFQDASAFGICTVRILDLNGQFKMEHIVTTTQSGTVLACFGENGDVLIYFVRSEETYTIKETALERVFVSKDRFLAAEVPPASQGGDVTHSFNGARYILSSPGKIGLFMKNTTYTLTRYDDEGERLIWSRGAGLSREKVICGILVNSGK